MFYSSSLATGPVVPGQSQWCITKRIASSRFVDKEDITARFREVEAKLLARHGLSLLGLPISKAILIGEKVMIGEADLEHFLSVVIESLPS